MILVIDNYDSFVHNLARYFRQLGCETIVVRNDRISVAEILDIQPEAIVLSPGPCTPTEAGCSTEIVTHFGGRIPTLGICLGHQTIVQALGGSIVLANEPVHGRSSRILHSNSPMFVDVPRSFVAGRYHSLIANIADFPQQLAVTARTDDGTIMAVEHRSWPVVGLQFHPESILTECGYQVLMNFLNIAGIKLASTKSSSSLGTPPLDNARARYEKPIHSSRLSTCDITGQKSVERIP